MEATKQPEDWDKPLVCPIDPAELAECEACQ
mgnify:CR=1 FL=1